MGGIVKTNGGRLHENPQFRMYFIVLGTFWGTFFSFLTSNKIDAIVFCVFFGENVFINQGMPL